MEEREVFTLRNRGIVSWLAGVLALASLIGALSLPAFWLAPGGFLFILVAAIAHSFRTGQWLSWQRWEPRLNWFEGWAASTGGVLITAAVVSYFFAG